MPSSYPSTKPHDPNLLKNISDTQLIAEIQYRINKKSCVYGLGTIQINGFPLLGRYGLVSVGGLTPLELLNEIDKSNELKLRIWPLEEG